MLLLFVFADTGGRPRNGSFSSWHYAPSDFLSKMVQGFDGALKTADEVIDNAHHKKLDHASRARDQPLLQDRTIVFTAQSDYRSPAKTVVLLR